ncbi:MAG: glycosyltransferase family 4 protein [Phocaeicola sp.]|nr:glycosyltransferase family 4 protein [Phocaeicola sp.]MDD7449350.1 glycosyltransferase family 4 protein [Prevotellaceae bacterium]MDY3913748.1 glycosyltransferase family 4 protein [Phocaeicola sp.]MDY5938561.1 glycosyltransferase family 4 protein [Phocaeicola sp.]
MKIVYCIAGTYNSGGMERVLANKANYWVKHGHNVFIVTTEQKGRTPFFALDERIKCYDLDIGYEDNNGSNFLKKLLQYPYKQFLHKRRLARLLHTLKADIVVSMFCNETSFLPSIKDGSKKVLEIHFSKFKRLQYGRTGIWKWADKWRTYSDEGAVKRFHKFVVLTAEDATYWGNLSNISVIPNARTFSPMLISPLTEKKVIAIGRYSEQKGFDRLIRIWAKVCEKRSDWHLDIVGHGELKEQLQKQIVSLGMVSQITLKPSTKDVQQIYAQASILALTSRYEGLPMVLLEAQAFGLPIVSYACKCGPRDIVSHRENGYLIEEDREEEFVSALLSLMDNIEMRKNMGEKALAASEQYAEDIVMQRWEDLFINLLSMK